MAAPGETPVLILTGPPGAGKTTTARVLADRCERAVHLESDLFFHFIRSGYVEPWRPESREQNEVVMQIVAGAATAYAAAGYFTIVDGDRPPPVLLRAAAQRAPRGRASGRLCRAEGAAGHLRLESSRA